MNVCILEEALKKTLKLRSGAVIPCIDPQTAEKKNYLSRFQMGRLHLMPAGEPVAFSENSDGSVKYYFDSERIIEAPPELWFAPDTKKETYVLENGTPIPRVNIKRAASRGFYTKEKLALMNYETVEEPVAYTMRDNAPVFFYDKKVATRLPLMCVKCGKDVRFRRKLCAKCFEEDLIIRRAEGDRHRATCFGMDPERVLFFDLELTGFYDHDEILSITIVNARGELIMDTLVRPVKKKKWKNTEKIHGITPEMVADAPTMAELTPRVREIFDAAENIIAYGVSTDYSHIKYIYDEASERDGLYKKIRCCANEFVRYAAEHRPDVVHASLTDAMSCFEIEWDGIAHTSMADTVACMKVWEVLFPNYYAD